MSINREDKAAPGSGPQSADTLEFTPEHLQLSERAPCDFSALSFSDVAAPLLASKFEQELQKLKPGERISFQLSGIEDTGWSVSVASDGSGFQLHQDKKDSVILGREVTYENVAPLADSTTVRSGERVVCGRDSVRMPVVLGTSDPFTLLSAPVVQLEHPVSSLHWCGQTPLGSRVSGRTLAGRTLYGHFAAHTDIGHGNRKWNEDAFVKIDTQCIPMPDGSLRPGTLLLGIDGMGGYKAASGLYMADQIAEVFGYEASLGRTFDEMTDSLEQFLLGRTEESQVSVLEESLPTEMGACITGALITRNFLKLQQRGDVRALLIRSNELVAETIDHSYAGLERRNKQLTDEAVFAHPERAVVYNSICLSKGSFERSEGCSVQAALTVLDEKLEAAMHVPAFKDGLLKAISRISKVVTSRAKLGHLLDQSDGEFSEEMSRLLSVAHNFQENTDAFSTLTCTAQEFLSRARGLFATGCLVESDFETQNWMPLQQDDILLIGSDGLFDVLTNNEVLQIVQDLDTLEEMVSGLREVIHQRVSGGNYKDDNILLMVYKHAIPFDLNPNQAP